MNRIRKSTLKGFTLIELMVTLAVAAILLTIGVPFFQELIANQRARTAAQDLYTGLLYTRSEAVKQNRNIIFSMDRDNSTNQLNGWVITSDATKNYANCLSTPDAACLRIHTPQSQAIIIEDGALSITYRSSGRLDGIAPDPFSICVQGANERQVSINNSGLPVIITPDPAVICP